MPRHTLDKWTYKLKTMNVCITQHKEEDIYNHMVKMYEKMEELYEKYKSIYDTIIDDLSSNDNNMYRRYNWKQGEPSRFWLKNANLWYLADLTDDQKEAATNEYFYMYQIYCDFHICDKYCDEWQEGWSNMVYDVSRMWDVFRHATDTILLYETACYQEEKARWQIANRQWIEDQALRKEHKEHPKIERPSTTDFDKEPEPYPLNPLRDDCIYCKQHWEEMKSKYDLAIQVWLKNKQEHEEWKKQEELEDIKMRKERERKAKEYQEWLEKQSPVDLHCDHCDYKAEDEDDLHEHNETEEHKEKLRYCKVCNVQCPSEYAYKNHLETTKHKKNAGIIDNKPKVYKCSHCDYQSITKANYERHLYSKHKNVD